MSAGKAGLSKAETKQVYEMFWLVVELHVNAVRVRIRVFMRLKTKQKNADSLARDSLAHGMSPAGVRSMLD